MASFTAQDVKKLREMTNCGMMDCKKALTETDGDMDKAIEFLREKGLATAAKKAGRIAAEGIVKAYMNGNIGVLVEVNSETDFVAKNQEFQDFVSDVAKTVADTNPADVDALKAEPCNGSTIGDMLTEKIAKIGENMNIRRFARIETDGTLADYIHAAGKIGVLVEAEAPDCDEVKECLRNVCRLPRSIRNICQVRMFPRIIKSTRKKFLSHSSKMTPRTQASPTTSSKR